MDVVIPWRAGCPHRQRALDWVIRHHEGEGRRVELGTCPEGPWIKALAVADALSRSTADIVVLADADVWCDELSPSIEAVRNGEAWSIPHHTVHRLTEKATLEFMDGGHPSEYDERPYKGRAGGGLVVLRRDVWEAVPMDVRFSGWGGEDDAWNLAVSHIFGKAARFGADLWHLWHPPQPRISRGKGSEASRQLQLSYIRAYRNPEQMQGLIAEARSLLEVA